jgi:glycosyltransferase involved in cell wall biosynthesis
VPDERVAVIIPAYNAAATLDETVRSIRGQSHADIEIVVVDDGSPDDGATLAIAEHHARLDPRVRAIRQDNAGVAAARNAGIAVTRSPFVACCDADDLWAPHFLERGLAAFREGGPEVGLVYSWFATIDPRSIVTRLGRMTESEGSVLRDLCLQNVVGNGSGALMRRDVLRAVGAYDPSLRARNAQGCEDWKLFFGIAERAQFRLVRDHLVGYRETPNNMSSEPWENLRSRDLCSAEFAGRHPELTPLLRRGRTRVLRFMLSRAFRTGHRDNARRLFAEIVRSDPVGGLNQLVDVLRIRYFAAKGQDLSPDSWARVGERYPIGDPDDPVTASPRSQSSP